MFQQVFFDEFLVPVWGDWIQFDGCIFFVPKRVAGKKLSPETMLRLVVGGGTGFCDPNRLKGSFLVKL